MFSCSICVPVMKIKQPGSFHYMYPQVSGKYLQLLYSVYLKVEIMYSIHTVKLCESSSECVSNYEVNYPHGCHI